MVLKRTDKIELAWRYNTTFNIRQYMKQLEEE